MKGKILSLLTVAIALLIAVGCAPSPTTVATSSDGAVSSASAVSEIPATPLYNPDMTSFCYSDNHGDYIDEDIARGGWNVSIDMFVSNDAVEGSMIGLTQLLDLAWGTIDGVQSVAGGFALVQRPDLVLAGSVDLSAVSNITFDLKSSAWSAADLKWLIQVPNGPGAGAEQGFLLTNEVGNENLTNADNVWTTVTLPIWNKTFTMAKNPVTFTFAARVNDVSQMFIKDITFVGYDGNPVTKAQLNLWYVAP